MAANAWQSVLVAAALATSACVIVEAGPRLRTWGDGPATMPACELVAVSWNVHKRDGPRFDAELAHHAEGAELVLLQESTEPGSSQGLPSYVAQVVTFRRRRDRRPTGVATASTAVPVDLEGSWAVDREPVARTPKGTLVSTFALPGQTLLVVNVHGINFRSAAALGRHLQPIGIRIAAHDGPVLLAGDLNTWSRARRRVVEDFAARHGLQAVAFGDDGPRLDWALTRGLDTLAAAVQRSRVSDHDALRVRLRATACGPDPATASP